MTTEVILAQGAESICAHRDNALRYLRDGLNLLHAAEREMVLAQSRAARFADELSER